MACLLPAIAIVSDVLATPTLKASGGFTRLGPSLATAIGHGIAFYCLSLALGSIPAGVAYAIWSGVGIALIAAIGWPAFGQRLDAVTL